MSMFGADFATGEFIPRYPGKCLNKNGKMPGVHSKITFRSSWESIFANWCDIEDNVIEWGSECIEIPYFSQIDNRKHKYVTDFIVLTRNKHTGKIEKWLVEVKPACQVPQLNECGAIIFPELNKKKKLTQKRIDAWQERCNVLRRNHEKWTEARKWASLHGYVFKIITQEELGLLAE